jgi:hypothetical protein
MNGVRMRLRGITALTLIIGVIGCRGGRGTVMPSEVMTESPGMMGGGEMIEGGMPIDGGMPMEGGMPIEGGMPSGVQYGVQGGYTRSGANPYSSSLVANSRYTPPVQAAPAITNEDIIRMADAKVGDMIILNAVKSQGGRFDLSPNAIIALNKAGVSEEVILEIQQASTTATPRAPGAMAMNQYNHTPHTVTVSPTTVPYGGNRMAPTMNSGAQYGSSPVMIGSHKSWYQFWR